MKPEVTPFFDEATFTASFVVTDPETNHCAIVDSVLDFDYASGRTDFRSADQIIDYVQKNGLTVDWILETHVHADHLSAAPYLQDFEGATVGTPGVLPLLWTNETDDDHDWYVDAGGTTSGIPCG